MLVTVSRMIIAICTLLFNLVVSLGTNDQLQAAG